jgi:hypothetical protein
LVALLGKDAGGLSASTIGRLKEAWSDERARWSKRDLAAKRYVYFWVDGIHVQARLEDETQCLLVIIGAMPRGQEGACRPDRRGARKRAIVAGASLCAHPAPRHRLDVHRPECLDRLRARFARQPNMPFASALALLLRQQLGPLFAELLHRSKLSANA